MRLAVERDLILGVVLGPKRLRIEDEHEHEGRGRFPEAILLDQTLLDRPQSAEIQLDLIGDYKTNVELYPKFQEFFRKYQPPTLAVWGKNDPFFIPPGAEAYKRDIPKARVVFYDTGHFALETHASEIGQEILTFLKANL